MAKNLLDKVALIAGGGSGQALAKVLTEKS